MILIVIVYNERTREAGVSLGCGARGNPAQVQRFEFLRSESATDKAPSAVNCFWRILKLTGASLVKLTNPMRHGFTSLF